MSKFNRIQVVVASDDTYIYPLTIMLFSLLENRSSGRPIDFHLISKDLTSYHQNSLKNLIQSYPNTSLSLLKISPEFYDNLATNSNYISDVTYYRFAIPGLLPELDRALYLDCDMIVRDDITKLWDIDLKGKSLGGIPEKFPELYREKFVINHYRRLGFDLSMSYFNAGVLLMDLEKWREKKLARSCIRYMVDYPEKIAMDDQDALNIVLRDDWHPLPLRWNIISYWYKDEVRKKIANRSIFEHAKDPLIVHYTGPNKPWKQDSSHYKIGIFRNYWLRYVNKCVFDIRLKDKKPSPGISLITICKETGTFKKNLKDWLDKAQIDEIILMDISGNNLIRETVEDSSSKKIVHVRLAEEEALNDSVLYNLGLRMATKDKILIVDSSCFIYHDFFEHHDFQNASFYSQFFWRDWFRGYNQVKSILFAYREDLIQVNGFHETLSSIETSANLFLRLTHAGKKEKEINSRNIHYISDFKVNQWDYDPFPEMTFPPLSMPKVKQLFFLKTKKTMACSPWDLTAVFTQFQLKSQAPGFWIAELAPPSIQPQQISFPMETIYNETFITWLSMHLSISPMFYEWIQKEGAISLSKRLFNDENLAALIISNTKNTQPVARPSNKIPQALLANMDAREAINQLDAVYNSVSWKLGSKIVRVGMLLFGWLPYFNKMAKNE